MPACCPISSISTAGISSPPGTAALGNLQLRPLLADKPKYLALSAGLGADFADPADLRIGARRDLADARAQGAVERRRGRRRRASQKAALKRSARTAHRARSGAEVAAARRRSAAAGARRRRSRPISSRSRSSSTATPGSRPIDALLANLNALYRQLTLGGDQSGAVEAGARPGAGAGRELARQCDATAAAARRHDGEGRQ